MPENLAAAEIAVEWDYLVFQARPQRADATRGLSHRGSHKPLERQVSITSTDSFWNALSAYDTGSSLASNEANAAGTAASASASDAVASSSASAASAQAGTLLSVLSGSPSGAAPSSASTLLSQVLNGKSSNAAVAVTSAVNQSILDTLL
jgi:hypothetical protein